MNRKLKDNFSKNYFEKKAWQIFFNVCGIDEVGRGCLAGPLVTAAVVLPQNAECDFLKDSKVLTEQQREIAYSWIIKNCFYSVAILSNRQIDRLNIYKSTLLCMKKSLLQLLQIVPFNLQKLKYVLVDAMPLSLSSLDCYNHLEINFFDKGESKSSSIAAASIVAKVTRDRLMKKLNNIFPKFDFGEHKGYGTVDHLSVLNKYDLTILHRLSFLSKIMQKEKECKQQISIF